MSHKILTLAGVQALGGLFPGWRIWADNDSQWHACRRGGYIQDYCAGSPAFSVHAASPAELAGLLVCQVAADATGPPRSFG